MEIPLFFFFFFVPPKQLFCLFVMERCGGEALIDTG